MDNSSQTSPVGKLLAKLPFKVSRLQNRKTMAIIGAGIVILVALSAFLIINQSKSSDKITPPEVLMAPQSLNKPWNTNPIMAPDKVIAKVGDEFIYGSDFNYVVYSKYNGKLDGSNPNKSTNDLTRDITDYLVNNSVMLQQAKKENKIQLNDSIFNNVNKDADQRSKAEQDLKEQIIKQSDTITAVGITIWYFNMAPPTIGEEAAMQIAKTKITDLQQKIKNKQMTIEQAATTIESDTELAKLDQNYKANAYVSVIAKTIDQRLFSAQELDQAAKKLKTGETSEVIQVDKVLPLSPMSDGKVYSVREGYFSVIQIKDRHGSGSFSEWLNEAQQQFSTTYY